MLTLKRVLPVSCVAGVLGALVFVGPAAADTYALSCQINGTVTTSEVALADAGPRSTYPFTLVAPLVCHVNDVGDVNEEAAVEVQLQSTGTYLNIVCGTGTLESDPGGVTVVGTTLLTPSPLAGDVVTDLSDAVASMNYWIFVSGGQGTLQFWTGIYGAGGGGYGTITISPYFDETASPGVRGSAFTADANGTGVYPGGVPGPNSSDCTDQFAVTGEFVGTFNA